MSAPVSVSPLYPLDETKPRDLLHHADLALYAAKANKATRTEYYVLYDPSVVQDATPPWVAS